MTESSFVQGAVSLWVGFAESKTALHSYSDCDTRRRPARTLEGDFGTGRYDHDFMEVELRAAPTQSLTELLRGCSYDTIVIPKFVELYGDLPSESVTAFVLLYNFQYRGIPGTSGRSTGGPVKLRYVGSIQVEMPWPD